MKIITQKKITQEELNEKVRLHRLWLENHRDGEKLDLSYANLSGLGLSYVNLSYVNLSYANLTDVDFTDSNLFNTIGNNKEIKTIQFETYTVVLYKDIIQIGCEQHTYNKWDNFTYRELEKMAYDAPGWWRKHKEIVLQLSRLHQKEMEI